MQEWEAKAPLLADLGATWHLVGHLQRNKAARAVTLFHEIDSLDTLPLAEKLERGAGEGRRLPAMRFELSAGGNATMSPNAAPVTGENHG